MQRFTVWGRLCGYNELNKHPWQAARKVKQDNMETVMWHIRIAGVKPIQGRCTIQIACFEPNAKRDVDNVTSGASKVILDALQQAAILKGDGRRYVEQVIFPRVQVDRNNPRIEVTIDEIQDRHKQGYPLRYINQRRTVCHED